MPNRHTLPSYEQCKDHLIAEAKHYFKPEMQWLQRTYTNFMVNARDPREYVLVEEQWIDEYGLTRTHLRWKKNLRENEVGTALQRPLDPDQEV